jgi:spermidine/putrescine transport system ATP-binding protein
LGNGDEKLSGLVRNLGVNDIAPTRTGPSKKIESVTAVPLVRLHGVSRRFGELTALHPVDLDIQRGEFLALLGPSGCGKTTLLRLIGGFLKPSGGRVLIDGRDVTNLPPERRRTNMVFQGYGLFTHMTVRQNIAYGLKVAKRPEAEITDRVRRMINLVHLGGMEDRFPEMLSGGQQQRVALARALVMEPAVLLLDEPLAALDLKLRKTMQEELRQLHRTIGGTFVFVTHDQGEAMALATRIAVMAEGRIVQQGAPSEIYRQPMTDFVAGFIGDANLLRGRRHVGRITLDSGSSMESPGIDGPVTVVLRPDDAVVAPAESSAAPGLSLRGCLDEMVYLGSHLRLDLTLPDGSRLAAHVSPTSPAAAVLGPGRTVVVAWPASALHIIEGS